MTMTPYDAITLNAEQAEALTTLLGQRLSALDDEDDGSELYALSIIAKAITEKLQLIRDAAQTWRMPQRASPGRG